MPPDRDTESEFAKLLAKFLHRMSVGVIFTRETLLEIQELNLRPDRVIENFDEEVAEETDEEEEEYEEEDYEDEDEGEPPSRRRR